jgi:glycosyltransferase involved in cell wall biosynthesis
MGRLCRQKGIDVLLRALPLLRSRFPGLALLIAGDGPERGELERLAGMEGAGDRVRFLGEWRRAPEFLAGLDLFILPSRWEGMPNALLEAMAAGVPVVASRVGGVPEIVTGGTPESPAPGETGIVVDPESVDELVRAVSALLKDLPRRESMAENARAKARGEFRMEEMIRRYSEFYNGLL